MGGCDVCVGIFSLSSLRKWRRQRKNHLSNSFKMTTKWCRDINIHHDIKHKQLSNYANVMLITLTHMNVWEHRYHDIDWTKSENQSKHRWIIEFHQRILFFSIFLRHNRVLIIMNDKAQEKEKKNIQIKSKRIDRWNWNETFKMYSLIFYSL